MPLKNLFADTSSGTGMYHANTAVMKEARIESDKLRLSTN